MLISKVNQCLLVPADPRLLAVIPIAKPYTHDAKPYYIIPHTLDTVRVLHNLGHAVHHLQPVLHYYDWPGRFNPMVHQRSTTAFATANRRAFILNDLGTGKTLSALWGMDYLMREGVVHKGLVTAPLSALERVYGDSIFQHFPHRRFAILHGTRAQRLRLLAGDFDFYIINHDGVATVAGELRERRDIDMYLLDEEAVYRNGTTDRWKVMKSLIRPEHWVWGMTGYPTPNAPTDAYAQVKLIKPENLINYPSFRSFQMATMDQVNMYLWRPKKDAVQTVHSIMQPSIRFTRKECLDLPECTYETLSVPLTPDQKRAYKELFKNLVTEIRGGVVTAANEAVKIMRLVQVVSGTMYDTQGIYRNVDCKPRLEAVRDIVESTDHKVIVFVPFTGSLRYLETEIGRYTTVAAVNGSTAMGERNRIFRAFQEDFNPRVIVAQPACMSHSLTLTRADTVIWWAPINSNEIYEQANGRINRQGQRNTMSIYHLSGTPVESKMYKRLAEKQGMQNLLLELVEEGS